jgi:pimeloyl-ACP methyl ester carboxylesterase
LGALGLVESLGRGWLRLRGVRSRKVATAVGVQHYWEGRGRGSLGTLVLQHGIGAGNAMHFALTMLFARRWFRRVIAPDLPGHGLSEPAPCMCPEQVFAGFAEVLDQTLDEPAVVCGNSLGGAMAAQYAVMRPERVRGLVLLSPAGAPMDSQSLAAFIRRFEMPTPEDGRMFVRSLYHRAPPGSNWMIPDIRRQFHAAPIRELLASLRPEHGLDAGAVRALAMPTLLMWGRSDQIMLGSMLDWFKAHLPAHAVVEEPERVGHCPQLDRPLWTARRLRAFAESLA